MIYKNEVSEAGKVNVETTTITLEGMTPTQKRARYDQLILEGKQRQEEAYVEELKASGTPIYVAAQVAARFGIPVNPTWVQKDLQHLMAVGDVFYPVSGLRAKADEIHKLYVVPGRDGMRAILQDVYAFYMKARASEHCNRIVSELSGAFVEKKHRANTNAAGIFVRSVFANFDDKQVHVAGKALEYCYFKNVAADDFYKFVKTHGGLEGVRKLAMTELPKTQKQLEEAQGKKALKQHQTELLAQWWDVKRKNVRTKFPLPVSAHASEFKDGADVILRGVVKNGEICIYWNVPLTDVVMSAMDEVMVDSLGHVAKNHSTCNGDVYDYIKVQLDWINNPPPAVQDQRDREAARLAAAAE